MNRYRSRMIRVVPFLTLCWLLGACQASHHSHAPQWDAKDPSCRVSGMEHVCDRQCRAGEVGPSGNACHDRSTAEGAYCDCGTR